MKSKNPPPLDFGCHASTDSLIAKALEEETHLQCFVGTHVDPSLLRVTVDGSNPANQLMLVVYPIIYMGFIHPRWLFGISAINSMTHILRT